MTFPTALSSTTAYPANEDERALPGEAASSSDAPRTPLPPPAAPPPADEQPAAPEPHAYSCPGCRRRLEMTHPMHNRRPEPPQRCKYPHIPSTHRRCEA
eukprot:5991695-Amphidinium_carterae.1